MDKFKEFIAELEAEYPEEMELARKEAKEWADKVKSGEIKLDIMRLYVNEDGVLEAEEELGPYTSCGACGGNGCDRCMPQWFEDD